jgi:hypothetical protein
VCVWALEDSNLRPHRGARGSPAQSPSSKRGPQAFRRGDTLPRSTPCRRGKPLVRAASGGITLCRGARPRLRGALSRHGALPVPRAGPFEQRRRVEIAAVEGVGCQVDAVDAVSSSKNSAPRWPEVWRKTFLEPGSRGDPGDRRCRWPTRRRHPARSGRKPTGRPTRHRSACPGPPARMVAGTGTSGLRPPRSQQGQPGPSPRKPAPSRRPGDALPDEVDVDQSRRSEPAPKAALVTRLGPVPTGASDLGARAVAGELARPTVLAVRRPGLIVVRSQPLVTSRSRAGGAPGQVRRPASAL